MFDGKLQKTQLQWGPVAGIWTQGGNDPFVLLGEKEGN